MAKLNMVQALNLALDQEMAKDKSVILLGQDIGPDGGVFRVTDGLHKKYGEDRVIDTPLAESGILGTSIGMAMNGLRPVCEMQFSGFSYIAFGQLEGHAARMRNRTQGRITLPLVMRMPYGGGVRALEHHSESHEATYAHVPGVKVVLPSGPRNARSMLVAAIRDPDPVVFMEPKHSYRAFKEDVPDDEECGVIGQADVLQEGTDLTVITWGAMLPRTQKAVANVAKARGCKIELIDLITVAPLDVVTIANSVKKTGRCVIVQEAPRSYSVGSEIIARINEDVLMHLEAPVKRVAGYDTTMPYFSREQFYIPPQEKIELALNEVLDF
ncbi:MAG: alpha-ketoacid dehydrogenase subunit beta [Planctomycetota bacterium]